MDSNGCSTSEGGHVSLSLSEKQGHSHNDSETGSSSRLAARAQSLPCLSPPFKTSGTATSQLDKTGVGALLGDFYEVPRAYRLNPIALHHTSIWDGQKIDIIQERKAHSDPGHTSQTAAEFYAVADDETVQGLKKEIDELENLLRISNNTVESLDKLVARYRSIYGELSEDAEPRQSDDDGRSPGRKRSRSISRSQSPENLSSHSSHAYSGSSCRKDGVSIAYDGADQSLSRKSCSRSSSLSSEVEDHSHSIDGRSLRTSQDDLSYVETPGRLPDPDDMAVGHDSRRGSIQFVRNSRTPSPLPEDIDPLSAHPFAEVYNKEENFAFQPHSERSARFISVANDRQATRFQQRFENTEADYDTQRDRVRASARRPARRLSPIRPSSRHWSNPTLRVRNSTTTPASTRREDETFRAPQGPPVRSRHFGPGPAHPPRRNILLSQPASWAEAKLSARQRPQPSPSRASSHRYAMDLGPSSSRDFAEGRRRTQEPRLVNRLNHAPEREPRKLHPEQSYNVRNHTERLSPYHIAHHRDRYDGDRRRRELRQERFSRRY